MQSSRLESLIAANRGRIRRRLVLLMISMVTVNLVWRIVRYVLHFPLWPDEGMVAMNFVGHGFWDMAVPSRHYYVQIAPLFFWWGELAVAKVLGLSDWSLRFLPFVAGIGGMLLFCRLATALLPLREALLSTAILAASYYPVRHATEVKPYSFDLLASVLIMWLGLRLWQSRFSIRRWVAFALSSVVAVWCSITSVFVAGGVMLLLVPHDLRGGGRKGLLLWLLTGIMLAVSFLLSLVVFILPMKQETGFLNGMWETAFPPLDRPWLIPWWMVTTHAGHFLAYPFGGGNFGSIFTLALVIAGVLVLWRRDRRKAFFLLAPAALSLLAAFLHQYPYGGSARVSQHLTPTICLLAGVGMMVLLKLSFRAKRVPMALVGTVAGLGMIAAVGIVRDVIKPYKTIQDARRRDAITEVARLSKTNDVWVVANQLYHRNTKTPLGYSAFSDASLEFYFYALAPGAVIGDSLEIAPRPGGTVWLLHHAHSGWSVKQEEMNRFVESFTRRFGTPQVRTWNIDSSERFEAYAFTAGTSARDTDTSPGKPRLTERPLGTVYRDEVVGSTGSPAIPAAHHRRSETGVNVQPISPQ